MSNPKTPTSWLRADGTATPNALRIEGCSADFELLAEDATVSGSSDKPKRRKFAMTAYTGGSMRPGGFGLPVVVDLAGVQVPRQDLPILRQHDAERIVGHTASIEVTAQRIRASGVISGTGDAAQEVIGLADNGFPWQASIGASVQRLEFVDRDQVVKVNGRSFTGPLYVVRASVLGEISFVPMGADSATSASVSATANSGGKMNTSVNGGAETAPVVTATAPAQSAPPAVDAVAELRAKLAAEAARVSAIQAAGAKYDVAADKIAAAIKDGSDAKDFELEALRAARASVQINTGAGRPAADNPRVIEAALAQAGRLEGAEQHFDAATMQAAHDRYKGRLSLQQMLIEAAMHAGYGGPVVFRGNERAILRAAFSGADINGILSNTANKFLLMGYMNVESTWAAISSRKNASDFKTMTSYRLTGAFQYQLVPAGGEIPHATASEQSFTNKVDTYGTMFAVTRQDMINDDLGALTAVPQRIGRGGALKLNDVFWSEFQDDASFFTTGRGNKKTTAGALTLANLKAIATLFRKLKDADGNPVAVDPRILLVPADQELAAAEIMGSTLIQSGATGGQPDRNVLAGRYQVVSTTYLSNTDDYYLLASPSDLPVMEVAFLNGVQSPIVETAEADFNTLGVAMRGYFDFGVAKAEYLAGIKADVS